MSEVFFEILSPLPLNSREDARKLFNIWAESAPQFFPDRCGFHEPLRQEFSLASMDEALRSWDFQFLLKRLASPKLEAGVLMQYGPHRKHATWTIGLQRLRDFEQTSFCNLLRRSAAILTPDFGLIHHTTEAETARGQENGSITFLNRSKTRKNLFVTTHILRKYVPDIYWTTLFGEPYVQLFSREKLLSAPAHRVEELENGSVVIQLTPDLNDTVTDEIAFESVRQAVRDHLDSDAIFDQKRGAEYRYKVPEFVWGPVLH